MTIREKLLINFEKCIFGLIWTDNTIGDRKSYFTLLEQIAGPHTNKPVNDTWRLYDVISNKWVAIKFNTIKTVLWESVNVHPDEIQSITVDGDHLSKQSDFQYVVSDMVVKEMPDITEKYKTHTDEDLCTEILCCTGNQLHPVSHTRDKLLQLLTDIEHTKIVHVIDHTKIIASLLKTVGVDVPVDRMVYVNDQVGRDDIREALNDITGDTDISLTWEAWKTIIDLHIKQHIRDLQDELADTTDEEDIEEINVAIELVGSALEETDVKQFKSVGDVCHFWPPLLYPPPSFVL